MHAASIRVTEDYLATLGVRLSAGRNFGIEDAEPEAIVSESVARQLGGAALIGRFIRVGDPGAAQRVRVIGIAPSIRLNFVDPRISAPLAVYLNFWQFPAERRYPTLLVQTHSGRPVSGTALQSAVRAMGHEYVEEHRTLDEVRDSSLVEDRALAYLAATFAGLALGLAATGLVGLLICYVAGRTGEIGIRMALGTDGAEIRALVVRQMIPVIAPGAALGIALTLAAGRLAAGNVYGVAPHDPRLLLVSVAILAATAAAAAWIPARRAASVEPVEALREG
jgi:hypothetical protein